jgi:hypothetical protein
VSRYTPKKSRAVHCHWCGELLEDGLPPGDVLGSCERSFVTGERVLVGLAHARCMPTGALEEAELRYEDVRALL